MFYNMEITFKFKLTLTILSLYETPTMLVKFTFSLFFPEVVIDFIELQLKFFLINDYAITWLDFFTLKSMMTISFKQSVSVCRVYNFERIIGLSSTMKVVRAGLLKFYCHKPIK